MTPVIAKVKEWVTPAELTLKIGDTVVLPRPDARVIQHEIRDVFVVLLGLLSEYGPVVLALPDGREVARVEWPAGVALEGLDGYELRHFNLQQLEPSLQMRRFPPRPVAPPEPSPGFVPPVSQGELVAAARAAREK